MLTFGHKVLKFLSRNPRSSCNLSWVNVFSPQVVEIASFTYTQKVHGGARTKVRGSLISISPQCSHSWQHLLQFPAGTCFQTLTCACIVSLLSEKQPMCDWQMSKITQSARYQFSTLALCSPSQPPCLIQYQSVSRHTDSASPSPPCSLFFCFPFVPSFSRLPPQLSVCGQRSTAQSQVPAGTAATGFTHGRH